MSARVLLGEHPVRGKLYAGIDPSARYVTPEVKELRFAALLSPFGDVTTARAALEAAGAFDIEGGSR
jgi:hypothetical protein